LVLLLLSSRHAPELFIRRIGETQGKSPKKRDMDRWENKEWGVGTKKLIFVKRL
jgi:hypothetical protein